MTDVNLNENLDDMIFLLKARVIKHPRHQELITDNKWITSISDEDVIT